MCLAYPSKVLAVDGDLATVEAAGQQRTVSLVLLDEPVAVGDYVLVMNNAFAFERVEHERAREALALIDDVLAGGDGNDIRFWH